MIASFDVFGASSLARNPNNFQSPIFLIRPTAANKVYELGRAARHSLRSWPTLTAPSALREPDRGERVEHDVHFARPPRVAPGKFLQRELLQFELTLRDAKTPRKLCVSSNCSGSAQCAEENAKVWVFG